MLYGISANSDLDVFLGIYAGNVLFILASMRFFDDSLAFWMRKMERKHQMSFVQCLGAWLHCLGFGALRNI